MKKAISVVLIISILAGMMLFLSGCVAALIAGLAAGNEPSAEYTEEPVQETYDDVYIADVENAIAAEIPAAPSAEKAPEAVTQGEDIAEMIYQRAYYEVLSVNGNYCTVQVTAPDMQTIYWDAFEQATANYSGVDTYANEEMETILLNIIFTQLESGNYPQRQATLDLELINGQPALTYEFADAMYGGMLTVKDEMLAAYEEG